MRRFFLKEILRTIFPNWIWGYFSSWLKTHLDVPKLMKMAVLMELKFHTEEWKVECDILSKFGNIGAFRNLQSWKVKCTDMRATNFRGFNSVTYSLNDPLLLDEQQIIYNTKSSVNLTYNPIFQVQLVQFHWKDINNINPMNAKQ